MESDPHFVVKNAAGKPLGVHEWGKGHAIDHKTALHFVITWLEANLGDRKVIAAGHRVVLGGTRFEAPVRIESDVLDYLDSLVVMEPSHQPYNVLGARALAEAFPGLPQVACFDSSFHRTMPEVAQIYALPKDVRDAGVRHWGYHGISYDYISRQVPKFAPQARRVIAAHLGGGTSMCAMLDGRSVETTMGFGAVSGLPMATRSGDVPSDALFYLLRRKLFDDASLEKMLYERAGLLGLSGISDDMRVLQESTDPRAVAAVEYFVYAMTKYAGAYAAVLGGLDAFVFTAGIGEHSAPVRAALCAKLAWLGVKLDKQANNSNGPRISTADSRRLRVGHSDRRGTDDRAAHAGAHSPVAELTEGTLAMKPNTAQPKAPESKPGSKPTAKDDLKSLPLAEVEKKLGSSPDGLTQAEAQKRLTQYGPNEIEEKKTNELLKFLSYFWGPIPWMIEAAVILSAVARHWPDFGIILLLLLANAVVGFWEEHQAGNAIAALKATLAIKARVKRDGKWVTPAARELVPGDVIRVRMGDIVPADARLLEGDPVEVDQSALTGESLPATRKSGEAVFSGSIVRQGEIGALVYATGANTYFGKTAELVQGAQTVSHFQRAVLKIGNYLIILAVVLVATIIAFAIFRGDPILTTLQFALVLTVAAIPVAMPTVLSVTMAVGARLLAKKKAIVTRLVAIEELAGVDVLCADKTGTLTQNKLTLGDPFSVNKIPAEQVILNAALASRADNNDTIDLAVLGGLKNDQALKGYKVTHFQPFDPVHKRTEATVTGTDGKAFKVTKGAPQVILALSANAGEVKPAVDKAVNEFAARGFRSLGVARADGDGKWQFLGVLPLFDPPREDAKATIATARQMGVKVKMVTGDALAIAQETAKKLGMGTNILDASSLGDDKATRDGGSWPSPSRRPTVSPRCSPNTSSTSSMSCKSAATSSA